MKRKKSRKEECHGSKGWRHRMCPSQREQRVGRDHPQVRHGQWGNNSWSTFTIKRSHFAHLGKNLLCSCIGSSPSAQFSIHPPQEKHWTMSLLPRKRNGVSSTAPTAANSEEDNSRLCSIIILLSSPGGFCGQVIQEATVHTGLLVLHWGGQQ